MTIIGADCGIITQINTFDVPPGAQLGLIENLKKASLVARDEPGWLSVNIHRSIDGTKVVNYAQSDSVESAQAVIRRLTDAGFIDRNRDFGAAHPGLYEVVFSECR